MPFAIPFLLILVIAARVWSCFGHPAPLCTRIVVMLWRQGLLQLAGFIAQAIARQLDWSSFNPATCQPGRGLACGSLLSASWSVWASLWRLPEARVRDPPKSVEPTHDPCWSFWRLARPHGPRGDLEPETFSTVVGCVSLPAALATMNAGPARHPNRREKVSATGSGFALAAAAALRRGQTTPNRPTRRPHRRNRIKN